MAAMNCKALRVLSNPFFHKDLRRRMATMPTGRAGDPDVHSEDPEEVEAVDAIREHGLNPKGGGKTENQPASGSGGSVPNSSAAGATRSVPLPSSPKVESVGVNATINPRTQQKREMEASAAICASVELPDDDERRRRQRKEEEEDDKKYFSNRKASPLSEIEFADTRKPITQATDGTANDIDGISSSGGGGGGGSGEVGEEDSLERAAAMWKQMRERGDPDSPHGRILRELRGEYW